MSRLGSLLLPLAALALAAFSSQARKTTTTTTTSPSTRISPLHRHLPPPTTGRHGAHHAAPPPGSAAAPWLGYLEPVLPPEPFPGFYKCLEKITEECGTDIYGGIIGVGRVSDRCCGQLVGLGSRCHNGILKATLELPELAEVDKSQIRARDLRIWSHCVFITKYVAAKSSFTILPLAS